MRKILLVLYCIFIGCSLENVRSFKFTYEISIGPSNELTELWLPIPISNEVQTISNEYLDNGLLDCSKHIEEIHGNNYYYCFKESGVREKTTIRYECDVKRIEHGPTKYKDLNPDNYDRGTESMYVAEGNIFKKVIADNNLSSKNIRGVYDFVLAGMHYGKPKNISDTDQYYSGKNPNSGSPWLPDDTKYGLFEVSRDDVVNYYQTSLNDDNGYTFGYGNSKYACQVGVGNCTDYHSYFMSLCRTMDVPARFHMGFPIPNNKPEGKIGGYHCWSDFYVDGEGWYPIDISEADKNSAKIDYFFGTIDKDRIELSTGRDLELINYNKPVNFFIYPIVSGTKIISKNFSYSNL